MKIHEIIQENNQVDEGLGGLLKLGAKAAIKHIPGVGRMAAKTRMATRGATKAAGSAATKTYSGLKVLGTISDGVLSAFKYYQLYQPVSRYKTNMENAEAKLKSGEWTQEQYDAVRQDQMSQLVVRLATMLTGNMLIGSVPALAKGLIPFGRTKYIGGTIDLLGKLTTAPAQAAFTYWANTDEGRKAIASSIGSAVDPGVVGSWGVWGLNKLENAVGMAQAKAPAKPGDPVAGNGIADTSSSPDDTNAQVLDILRRH